MIPACEAVLSLNQRKASKLDKIKLRPQLFTTGVQIFISDKNARARAILSAIYDEPSLLRGRIVAGPKVRGRKEPFQEIYNRS